MPVSETAFDVILIFTIITHFPSGESITFKQRGELLWVEEKVKDEQGKSINNYRIRVCHISNEHHHDKRDTIYPNHFTEPTASKFSSKAEDTCRVSLRGQNSSYFYLSSNTIMWLASKHGHTMIHTVSGVFESVEKLSDIVEKYPQLLCRVHTCYAVNPRYVASIGRFYVALEDETRINIPEKKYTKTRNTLNKRIEEL